MTEQNSEPEVLTGEALILSRLYKPQHVQDALILLRDYILHDRAYMKLNFTGDSLYDAAAASAYSLARLHLIDQLIDSGKVLESL